jgi:23S rRNA (uracil1939-C5)-methyltransferase
MKRKPYKILPNITVATIAGEGKGLARSDGRVIFVEDGLPGDKADILLTQTKKDYAIGRIHTLHQPSPLRIEPFCKHFGSCGGCKWQHIDYATQLQFKEEMVQEAFTRIGKVAFPAPRPILGCDRDRYYRNKMEYTFSAFGWLSKEQIHSGEVIDRRALGFHVPGRYESVAHIETCFLMDHRADEVRNGVYRFACDRGLTFYDLVKHTGLLRNLLIRTTTGDEWMVVVAFAHGKQEDMLAVMQYLDETFPFITCLQYTVNIKRNDAWHDVEIIHYAGKDHITEQIGMVRFRISAKSFFQTNSTQARKLYDIIHQYAGLTGNEVVYDLYTGTGSIALYLAKGAGKVVGIEHIGQAVEDAGHNAGLNSITNASFETGTVEQLLDSDFLARHGQPDVVITDPPRAGMHPRVVEVLLEAQPQRIVYVSCNPATQARDLQALSAVYDIMALQPVDMFPQTWHIENVALLEKRR